MAGLPPLSPKKVLRFKDEEEEEEEAPDRRRPSRLPSLQRGTSLQRRTSLLAYEPIIARFVKNGDKFFEGVKLNISQRNVRSWDTLLAELSRKIELPAGVRNIYTPEGGHRIKSLSQLQHQGTYVCGSLEPFKKMDYNQVRNPDWKSASRVRVSDAGLFSSKNFPLSPLDPNASLNASIRSTTSMSTSSRSWTEVGLDSSTRQRRFFQRRRPVRLSSITEPPQMPHQERGDNVGVITLSPLKELGSPPKLEDPLEPLPPLQNQPIQSTPLPDTSRMLAFTVIRNAPPPREHTTIYINKNLMKSWEEATQLISKDLKTINGCLRLFRLDGEEVLSLSQLWKAGTTLIAAGNEKFDIVEFLKGGGASTEEDMKSPVEESSLHCDPTRTKGSTPVNTITPSQDTTTPNRTENAASSKDDAECKLEVSTDADVKAEEELDVNTSSKCLVESNSEPSIIARGPVSSKEREPSSDEQNTSVDLERAEQKRIKFDLSDSSGTEEASPLHYRRMSLQFSPLPHSNPRRMSLQLGESPMSASYPLIFPPTPPSEISLGGRRPRPRRLISMLEEARPTSNSSSLLESPLLHAKHRNHKFNAGHFIQPQTPLSDISMDVAQSLVDMVIPGRERKLRSDDESSISNLSSKGGLGLVKHRNVSIQTNFVDDHLSTFAEADEVFESTSQTKFEDNGSVSSQTGTLEQDLDASTAASQLYKLTKDKYHVGMAIAEGSFAIVKHCTDKQENKEFLLRVIQRASVFGQDDKILREVDIMRMIRHENVQTVLDYWETTSEMCMVMEPIEGGDLFDAILHCQHFSESDAMEAMRQLGLALVYLHANSIVHRGVKPENIFLSLEGDGTWTLKLAGFSLATKMSEPLTLVCGNEYYRAPEMITGRGYGTKADVWSAGVIAYILLSGIMPFRRRKRSHISSSVFGKVSFPSIYWEDVSNEAKDFIRQLLMVLPQDRYSSSHLMQHSWLKRTYVVSELSKKLVEYLTNKAAIKVASVPILTVTALDEDMKKTSRKRKSVSTIIQKQQ